MAVSNATIRKDTWDTVYTLLNTTLTDPAMVGTTPRSKWIIGAFPNTKKAWAGYPIVVIEPVDIDTERYHMGLGSQPKRELNVPITIYTTKSLQIDSISDEIENDIRTNNATFQAVGLNVPLIQEGSSDAFELGGDRVHTKTIMLNFRRV